MDTLTTTPPASYGELVDFWNTNHSTFFPTSAPAMVEELQAETARLRKTIDSLTIGYQRSNANVDQFMDTLASFLTDGDINESVAEDLASCFGRDLTRKVNVTVTAEIEMEVMVPFGYDVEDLENDLCINVDTQGLTEINIDSWFDTRISIEEN